MKTWTIVALGAIGAVAAVGCDKKENIPVAPAASSLAPSMVAPTAMTMKFAVDSKGATSIDMPAPKEHIKATTDGATGMLDVDLKNTAEIIAAYDQIWLPKAPILKELREVGATL